MASAFSGGLFLSVGMIHLLPEAQSSIDTYWEEVEENQEHFPFVFFITVVSFSIILWIEKVVTVDYNHHSHSHDENHHNHNHINIPDQQAD